MPEKNEPLNFEKAFQELQVIIAKLETSELPLEEALKLYEQGQKLATDCGKFLESAQLRVQMLNPDKSNQDNALGEINA
ncbi:MAG: exodeoxyribonuclease VII small subunit [Anaerolineaceae bacterium]|nr:exodeoxyribonuclease VII small subunit [Anaerolineaceae bacterium]